MEKRLIWIDWAKVIAIFLVVLGHFPLKSDLLTVIYSFHMPLFFIISGVLEKGENVKTTVKKSIKSLIIPYITFFFLTYLFWFLVVFLRNRYIYPEMTVIDAIVKPVIGMILGVGYDTKYSININTPLWFLIGLFFCRIYFAVFMKIFNKNDKKIAAANIFLVVCLILIKKNGIDLFFSIDSAILALPFYTIGFYLKNRIHILEKQNKIGVYILVICIASNIIMALYNGRVDINGVMYGKSILIFYINGLVGSIGIIIGAKYLEKIKNEIVVWYSSGTIVIMALHGTVQVYILKVTDKLGIKYLIGNNEIFYFIIIALIVTLIHILPIKIIENKIPFLIGKRRTIKKN